MKHYPVVFFDWDGTAVTSRTSGLEAVLSPMIKCLEKGIKLIIISGTTYDNIANGELHHLIPKHLLSNLYLGLARGAYNYGFNLEGELVLLQHNIPSPSELLKLHDLIYSLHHTLLSLYQLPTDIVFSRPNYCKLDLLVNHSRKGQLYMQSNEIELLNTTLKDFGYLTGIKGLMEYTCSLGSNMGLKILTTTDAKYLEIGFTTKSDNVNYFMTHIVHPLNLSAADCSFWGDEFAFIGENICGSDAQMLTPLTQNGDFYDVSLHDHKLPSPVKKLGGGTKQFISFLEAQGKEATLYA